jgi:hypothetical protein
MIEIDHSFDTSVILVQARTKTKTVQDPSLLFSFPLIIGSFEASVGDARPYFASSCYSDTARRIVLHKLTNTFSLPLFWLRSNQGVELTYNICVGVVLSKSRI